MHIERNEFKFFINEREVLHLTNVLSHLMIVDKHCAHCKPYTLTSAYLDDFYDTNFMQKLQGINFREKYRLRFYNHNYESAKFEVKRKHHNNIEKISHILTRNEITEIFSGKYTPLLDNENLQYVYYKLKYEKYEFKTIVEYDRLAFYLPFNNIRITLDLNLRSITNYSVNSDLTVDHGISLMPRGYQILELKYTGELPGFVRNVLSGYNLTRCSISKYVLARLFNNAQVFEDRGELPY